MADSLKLRCSSLPLIALCSASAEQQSVILDERSDPAAVGTDAHTHLARMVMTGRVDWDGISSPETRSLVWHGQRMWRELQSLFPSPECEVYFDAAIGAHKLSGHSDVRSGSIGVARVLDWKSGRVDTSYREQLLGYAALELISNSMLDRVETLVVWLRDEEVERYSMERSELEGWVHKYTKLRTDVHSPGSHCVHCHRAHECPGLSAVVRRDSAALLDLTAEELERGLSTMTPGRIIELARKAKLVSSVADRARQAIRNHVIANGDVEAEGSKLTITTESRRNIDTAIAWPVLQEHLTDTELAASLTVRMSAVHDAIKAKAPQRKGAASIREFTDKLEAAGAISTTTVSKLTERRTK